MEQITRPESGTLNMGDVVYVTPPRYGRWRNQDGEAPAPVPAKITAVARVWLTIQRTDGGRHFPSQWRMRRDTQDEGDKNYPQNNSRFVTPAQLEVALQYARLAQQDIAEKERPSGIIVTVTGWIINAAADAHFNDTYRGCGDLESTLAALHAEALREDADRRLSAPAPTPATPTAAADPDDQWAWKAVHGGGWYSGPPNPAVITADTEEDTTMPQPNNRTDLYEAAAGRMSAAVEFWARTGDAGPDPAAAEDAGRWSAVYGLQYGPLSGLTTTRLWEIQAEMEGVGNDAGVALIDAEVSRRRAAAHPEMQVPPETLAAQVRDLLTREGYIPTAEGDTGVRLGQAFLDAIPRSLWFTDPDTGHRGILQYTPAVSHFVVADLMVRFA